MVESRKKRQRGRESAAALSVVSELKDARQPPPDDLSSAEQDLWRRIMRTKPPKWWDEGSLPLLREYCQLDTRLKLLQVEIGQIDAAALQEEDGLERLNKLTRIKDRDLARAIQLAMKMRLTQQARYDASKAAVASKKTAPRRPWDED